MRMIVSQIKAIRAWVAMLEKCGPLTPIQLQRLTRITLPNRSARYLVELGYAGILPTRPFKLIATGKQVEMPEMPRTMVEIINVLKLIGPASSSDIAKHVGKTRETVDSYLRQGKEMEVCHVCGDRPSEFKSKQPVYLWMAGPGENYVRGKSKWRRIRKTVTKPAAAPIDARRDALTEALFGVAA